MKLMEKIAPFLVVTAAVCWGILVIFVRELNSLGLSSMEIVCVRVYLSALVMILILLIHDRRLLKIHMKDIWCFVGTGVLSIVFFNYCYFTNVQISSAAFSAVFMYTSPIWVMLLSAILFHERITRIKLAALVCAICGCVLVSGITGGLDQVSAHGVLLGLGSGIGYGLYTIFGRYALNKGYHPMTISAYTFLCACLGVLPFVSVSDVARTVSAHTECLLPICGMVLISTCASFTIYTIGLKYVESGKAAVMATLEPLVTTTIGVCFYKEPLTVSIGAGIVLVLAASLMINFSPSASK